MPPDHPAAVDDLFHHELTGFIHLVDIPVEIIIDDITACGNQH
jgi:hypothetical protein